MPIPLRRLLGLGLLAVLASAPPAALAESTRPTLLVLLSVDQMRGDYVERYGHHWTGGLKRLIDEGARFPLAAYPYQNTVTCAGHATMSTGVFPATHGMVLNAWWDRASGQQVGCTHDPGVTNIGYGGGAKGGDSPHRLLAATFADELRTQLPVAPRIVSLSMKARSAIAMAGRRADAVVWFADGRWTTSSYYTREPVSFVARFIEENPIERDYGSEWTKLLPEAAYLFDEAPVGERGTRAWGPTFPHALSSQSGQADDEFYASWSTSPQADAYLARLGIASVEALGMGRGPGVDFLALSFSVLDTVGHAYGPRSHEVQDVLARLDRALGGFFADLDRLVGRGRYVVAFTGDHGVAPVPEQMEAAGMDAGRVPAKEYVARLQAVLERHFGPGTHLASLTYTDVYFAPGLYDRLLAAPQAMREVIGEIEATPGIHRVLRSDDLAVGRLPDDALARSASLSYHRSRSGDLIVIPRPFWLNSTAVSTHGTAYEYDTRVPVILMGPGIGAGVSLAPATPADIPPTFAYLAGITMARIDGRVLTDALLAPGAPGPPPQKTASPQ
jgi:predicted AlkP superfamily pyrophosphatase or phosphodiesterase